MERHIRAVQIDGLVLLKIVKHCQDEIVQPQDVVSGVLLGLWSNDVLEVTHSFPIPKMPEDLENGDNSTYNYFISTYPTQMIRQLREVNVDYMEIGLYQSSYSGAFLNRISLENLYHYHRNLDESVMLIFDSSKTSRGQIALKAFQLTNEMKNILSQSYFDDVDSKMSDIYPFSADNDPLKFSSINVREMWQEIPVIIRNSHLINALIGTIDDKLKITEESFTSLDLGVGSNMENHLKIMMDNMDNLCQHIQAHVTYNKLMSRGNKERLPPLPHRLDTSLLTAEIIQYCQDLSEMCGQTIGKLMLAKGVHKDVKKV